MDIQRHVHDEIQRSQLRQAEGADRRRSPAPVFRPGDFVFLSTKNLRTRRPSLKLDDKKIRCTIDRMVSPWAYRLILPAGVKIHPVQHVSLLSLDPNDPLPGQRNPEPGPVFVDGQEEYAVDDILDSRLYYGQLQYLVKWTGYDRATWSSWDLVDELEAVDRFHDHHPSKPGPQESL